MCECVRLEQECICEWEKEKWDFSFLPHTHTPHTLF
jgi:hypothetical protein